MVIDSLYDDWLSRQANELQRDLTKATAELAQVKVERDRLLVQLRNTEIQAAALTRAAKSVYDAILDEGVAAFVGFGVCEKLAALLAAMKEEAK